MGCLHLLYWLLTLLQCKVKVNGYKCKNISNGSSRYSDIKLVQHIPHVLNQFMVGFETSILRDYNHISGWIIHTECSVVFYVYYQFLFLSPTLLFVGITSCYVPLSLQEFYLSMYVYSPLTSIHSMITVRVIDKENVNIFRTWNPGDFSESLLYLVVESIKPFSKQAKNYASLFIIWTLTGISVIHSFNDNHEGFNCW